MMTPPLVALLLFASLLRSAHHSFAQDCGSQASGHLCPPSQCCSQFGFCGVTNEYCGRGCQSGPCAVVVNPTPANPGKDLASIVNIRQFTKIFPTINPFYTYDSFLTAAEPFHSFANEGTIADRIREVAAFLAHAREATRGLTLIQVSSSDSFCSPSTEWPCAPNQKYFGRGPLLLTWNFNYGAAGDFLGLDLLSDPSLVSEDPVISFQASLWFWTTPPGSASPSCHTAILGSYTPSAGDRAAGRFPGFGLTIDIINGADECNFGAETPGAQARIATYKSICSILGVDPGPNLGCSNMKPF